MVAAPSYSEEMEIVTGAFSTKKGTSIIKVTNDKFTKIEKKVSVLKCSDYQPLPRDEWRTNINPEKKDDDQFTLSAGNTRYFSIQFKNPGCYQICLLSLNASISASACYPIVFKLEKSL